MKYGREAADRLRRLPAGQRRLYLTLADEGYRHEQGVNLLVAGLEAAAPRQLQWLYVPQGDTETHASIYHGGALDAFRALYGLPARIYLPPAAERQSPATAPPSICAARRAGTVRIGARRREQRAPVTTPSPMNACSTTWGRARRRDGSTGDPRRLRFGGRGLGAGV